MAGQTFGAEVGELRRIAAWVRGECARAGLPDETALDLELCVDEVVSNIIKHGFDGPTGPEVWIDLVATAQEARVVVQDEGRALDPLVVPRKLAPLSLDDLTVGGYGLVILRALARDLSYQRTGGRNILAFTVARS
jgi:serine/threonine-protein kinase RsbW